MTFLAYTSRQTVTEFELSLHGDDAKHIISCKWYLIIDPRVPLVGARHLTRVKSPTLIALYPPCSFNENHYHCYQQIK